MLVLTVGAIVSVSVIVSASAGVNELLVGTESKGSWKGHPSEHSVSARLYNGTAGYKAIKRLCPGAKRTNWPANGITI